MVDIKHEDLINGEIDRDLDAQQRGELARRVLADPQVRELREDLRFICAALEAVPQADPPPQLKEGILAALPEPAVLPKRPFWSTARLRYAAMIAGALVAGGVVYETVGPGLGTTAMSGTMASAGAVAFVDTVRLGHGPIEGTVGLYHNGAAMALAFDVEAQSPVDVVVKSNGHTLRVEHLRGAGYGARRTVDLPGPAVRGQTVDLTFLVEGRPVAQATLKDPMGP